MSDVKKFPTKPYFDDFAEDKNFLRVLFRPGYVIQTRELNQIQTILQNQIGTLADYSIPDGSSVIGGKPSLVNKLPFIKLATGTTFLKPLNDYEGLKFESSNGVEGTVKFALAAAGANPATLYVKYDKSAPTSQLPANGDTITITHEDSSTELVMVAPTAATGNAAAVILTPGIFYVNKSFVRTDDQLLLINRYNTVIEDDDISVGFYVTDEVIRPEQDISLLDNATGAPSETSPGAHRYKCRVVLANKESLSDAQLASYKELMKIRFGKVAAKPRTDSDVAVLEQILARRTYDQAGDYIVDDFIIDVREHLTTNSLDRGVYTAAEGGLESKMVYEFDKGVAYVRGYEINTEGNAQVVVNKARTASTISNALVQTQYDNAFFCYNLVGMPQMSAKIDLYAGATICGTAFIRSAEYYESTTISSVLENVYRIDVLGAKFNAGYSWQNITEIRHNASVADGAPFSALVNSYSLSPAANSLVYKLPKLFASEVLPRVSFFNKELTVASSSGTITVPAANANETFDDERSSYMLQHPSYNGGEPVRPLSVNIVGTSAVLNVSDTFGSGSLSDVKLIVKTFTSAPTIRTKTFVPAQVNSGVTSAALITLSKADVTSIVSVITSGGVNVTNSYELLSNVKDTHYERSQIRLKSGETLPAGTLTITFSYFEHSAAGDFFTADSYSGIPYNSIPTYTMGNGERIFMGSVVDYRQRITSSGTLEKVGRHSFVTNDQLILDETFYLPRMDRVVLTHLGRFVALTGTPSSTPVLKPEIDNAITLYTIYVPPYTFSTSDLVINKAKHRRFTMKDIAKIENRVENVEEVTLLNSLERDVQRVEFKDRFKSGFIADNFASQNGADTQSSLHRCAYDLRDAEVRPRNTQNPIDLNRVTSSGMTYHANGVGTLSYTQKPMISQNLGSTIIRIQPYILYDWIGTMTLTPSSDIWFDNRTVFNTSVTRVIAPGRPLHQLANNGWSDADSVLGSTWRFASSSWLTQGAISAGRNETAALNRQAMAANSSTSFSSSSSGGQDFLTVTRSAVNSVTSNRSVSAIPFIRPRVVKFEVSGMKPGTRVYPFFANVLVSQHCSHTIGSWGTPLHVAGNGTCVGHFNIPANTFMTGVREFVLKDVASATEEHDTTRASKEYTASGTLITTTTTVNSSTTSLTYWSDPLAQSFFVDENTGVFIKSIDVYFGPGVDPSTNSYDVVCEIRPMVNGYPGLTAIASTRVEPSAIYGSVNGFTPTRMEFTSPVYLNSGVEYCFVLLSGNDKITVWGSTLGKRAYRPTDVNTPSGEIISKQPYLGSLFKSQNSTTWTADQTQDLKFVINKCEFGSSGSVTYRNGINPNQVDTKSNVYKRALAADPLRFNSGSKGVGVVAWGHGFQVGDVVTLSKPDAATAGPYHGIPHTELFNVPLTVTDVTDDAFTVEVSTTNAVLTGSGGGSDIEASWVIDFSYAELITDNFVAPGASLDYTLRAKRKAAYGAGLSGTVHNLEEGDIVDLKEMYVCKASDDSGLQLTITVNSDSRNISPLINEDRMLINVTKNIVNNTPFLDTNGDVQIFSSPAAYVQHTVQLETPSNELRVIVDANMPAGTSINAYYKVSQTTISDDDPWIKLPVDRNLIYTDNPDEFREQKFIKQFENEYSTFKVMIQMVSSNPIRVPRIKNYRALALAT